MAKTGGIATNQNHDGDASSSQVRSESNACWSDLNHDLLALVMMRLGAVDFLSFRGVCKSWRSFACSNAKNFMASMPPMSITISNDADENVCCYLEDFKGRKFKTILPHSAVGSECVGLTCGYLIFLSEGTHDFWLVNPITRSQLHFPHCPCYHPLNRLACKAILVFSTSISGLVFVVFSKHTREIWFCIEGKGAWNCVSDSTYLIDIYAFKGKIYILTYSLFSEQLCELRLSPHPKLTTLTIKRPNSFDLNEFFSAGENLYVMDSSVACLYQVDLGEMKWVKKPFEKKIEEEYAFFHSKLNRNVVAVKRESWAYPRSRSHVIFGLYLQTYYNERIRFFEMWYFPHQCMDVDCIDN